jgi:PEGA domain
VRRHMKRSSLIVVLFALVAISWPASAYAQRRGRGPSRVVVMGGGPYFYDPFFYSPWFGSQWGYPYPYPPYGGYRLTPPDASVRLEVEPKNASVFVDGYFAGTVDEFDGVFQRLHVEPGQHEIVVYLEGFRSIHERLYVGPNSSRKIAHQMEKLGAGEANEPRPTPSAEARSGDDLPPSQAAPPSRRRGGPMRRGPDGPPPAAQATRSGTVAIRVQPGDAEILIDGERWAHGSGEDDQLIVQLADGPHHVEAQKEGYRRMSVEVEVRRGETSPVNISLSRE